MDELKVIEVHQSVYAVNDSIAEQTRRRLKASKTFMLNIMASPGAGKTSMLLETIRRLKGEYRIGVMEADIEASVDAEKMKRAGVYSIQVHTGGECAMDAEMTRQALNEIPIENIDILFLENVGNLVCPAETDTGASKNVAILSVPEGDDKPLKYPLMFRVCDVILISKIDTKEYFPFDERAVVDRIHNLNPKTKIFFISAKQKIGFEPWIAWIKEQITIWKNNKGDVRV